MSLVRSLLPRVYRQCRAFSNNGPNSWGNLVNRNEESGDFESVDSEDAPPSPSNFTSKYRPASNRPYRDFTPSAPSPQAKVETVHPFPEELDQDYSLPLAEDSMAAPTSFPDQVIKNLNESVPVEDVEIKPDGSIYLPEVRYRRILLRAFGPAGWCLVPRGAHSLTQGVLSREYALLCHGRFIAQARGSAQLAHTLANPALASEAVRSNALMRCCKDLGVASDLWDNSWVSQWKATYAIKKQVSDAQGRTRFTWYKKDL